jgi:type I restriction enzyme S subunit
VSEWQTKRLGDVLQLNYGKSLPLKSRVDGAIPVYGSNGIVGSHNYPIVDKPGLVVGRKGSAGEVHFSRRPFCPIDTTFYVTEDDAPDTDLEFLFYLLRHVDLRRITGDVGVPGLNREMAYMEPVRLPAALPEQKKIAHILSTVQRAIEAQERIIQTTTDLKKALMHKLFTEGLRNEPQKQTEIGPVPESWEVVTVQDLVDRDIIDKPIDGNHGEIHPKVADFVSEGIPFIMASDLKGGLVDLKTCNFLTKERADSLRKGFSLPGDVLISHKATIGETAIVPAVEHYIMLTPQVTYYRVLDRDALSNRYLRCYFDSPTFQKPLKNVAGDGSTRAYIGITKQRGLPVLVPKIDEQRELADILGCLDEKIRQAIAKEKAFSDLFRTLLHELMTAKTRVANINLAIAT